jgi:hypothetical protein
LVAASGYSERWSGCQILIDNNNLCIQDRAIIGTVEILNANSSKFTIDNSRILKVKLQYGQIYGIEHLFQDYCNLAMIGNEIIKFGHVELQNDGTYIIKHFLPALYNSPIFNQSQGDFILLDTRTCIPLNINNNHLPQIIEYQENNIDYKFDFIPQTSLSPIYIKLYNNVLSWVNPNDSPTFFYIELLPTGDKYVTDKCEFILPYLGDAIILTANTNNSLSVPIKITLDLLHKC